VTDPPGLRGPAVPALAEVTGPVLDCAGRRGAFGYSLAGYAALGEVIADRAGEAYQDAAARLVLEPLGMRDSWFPRSWPAGQASGQPRSAPGPAVTGYDVTADGTVTPPGLVCLLPAAGGLWSTAADLARLVAGWSSLLPRSLAAQALRPHATRPNGMRSGLGWAVNEHAGRAGHGGDGPGGAASLLVTLDGGHACAALANRQATVEPVNAQALAAMAGGSSG
jgi:D-alanyl-D-alanine carboxypeptidase